MAHANVAAAVPHDLDTVATRPRPPLLALLRVARAARMRERLALFAAYGILMTFPLSVLAVTAHARRVRDARHLRMPAIVALAARLPSSDLALAGGSRALRSPSLEEPSAAFTDAPASLDQDPAGGLMAPPRAVWVDIARPKQDRK